jgi:protein ImuB
MAPHPKPRAWPELPPSDEPAPRKPRLQPAGGGGCERDGREAARHPGTRRELWLAIHLPQFVLESLRGQVYFSRNPARISSSSRKNKPVPSVVVNLEGGGKVVCACNAAAAAGGISAGMTLNSALALLPRLTVLDRNPRRERELLEALATWAVRYTPRVVLEPPDTVLLEIRGSLRLFGGSRKLCARMRAQLDAAGLAPRLTLTPTPLASLWFARAGEERVIGRTADLAGRLAALPLACTHWPARSLQLLATMGVQTVGDCLRLPRDGFARRLEPHMLDMLDRAIGRCPDPRGGFLPRERFAARRDLEPEVAEIVRLDTVAAPLLAELCAFLRQRRCGVQGLELRLTHREAPPTRLRLRFTEPISEPARIAQLLGERLARIVLPEPVRALHIESGVLVELREGSHELFAADRRRAGAGVPQLVERLRARLGAEAVYGLRLIPEHRPELAWEKGTKKGTDLFSGVERSGGNAGVTENRSVPIFENNESDPFSRPLWLLAEPQPLEGDEQPRFEGRLEIEQDPERIESGWWDGRDVARDYYVARTPAGARLWVFRERRSPGRWFLHGVFG